MLHNLEKNGKLLETCRLQHKRKTSNIRRSNQNQANVWTRICTPNRNTKRKNRSNAKKGAKANNENRHNLRTNEKGKERSNDNEHVLKRVNATINTWGARRKNRNNTRRKTVETTSGRKTSDRGRK